MPPSGGKGGRNSFSQDRYNSASNSVQASNLLLMRGIPAKSPSTALGDHSIRRVQDKDKLVPEEVTGEWSIVGKGSRSNLKAIRSLDNYPSKNPFEPLCEHASHEKEAEDTIMEESVIGFPGSSIIIPSSAGVEGALEGVANF
eukprot:Gb_12516 [translate_table: standard]